MELIREGLPITMYAQDYALPWSERLQLFLRVCHAVQYAHEHLIVHRDLKPANILVDREGRPFVIDFGLALACETLLPGLHLASGTPAYMSPEQVAPVLGTISDRSDVYALGLILYELLTGQLPYTLPRDGAVAQWRHVILEATPPPLRPYHAAYGGELEAIVSATLTKRPAERLSVAALRARLERYLQAHAPARDPLRHDTHQAQREQTGTAPGSRPPHAERRQLTILCCDLVASTALATQLDPEDLREVIRAYHTACTAVIQRFDGYMAQLGASVLVYYGYPQAHEDGACRAVWTGLGCVEAMDPLNARLEQTYGVRLAVRVGIHTGLVVVGELGVDSRQESLALGATPTIAARLQEHALPDTVVVSDATWRLVQDFFIGHDLGIHPLPGAATAVQLYQILRERPAQNRFAVALTKGLSPLVGRQQELGLLHERWVQATDGLGQVVLLSGEAGIGKSRLVQALKEHPAGDMQTCIECYGSPYYQQSAFYPLVEQMQRRFQWSTGETPEEKLRKLEVALLPQHSALEEVVPLFAALLGLPLPERYPPLALTPQLQKQRTLAAMLAWLLKDTERQPVCLVMEDIHWVDASTLEFLSLLIDQVPTTRMLVLLLFRPDFRPPWTGRSHLTQLTLARLTPRQVTTMVAQLTGEKALPAEVHQHVVATTDGVPLFVEESTKMVLESGLLQEREGSYVLAGPLPPLAIPATLYDTLMARLDRLGPAKQVAQLGAVLGKEFAYAAIQAVSLVDEATLHSALGRLVEAEFLYQRGLPPHATYLFKHALIQEAAYQSLLRSTRRQYHQRIAQVLEERFPEVATTEPEVLARHYAAANLKRKALDYAHKAGITALQRSANAEAIQHTTGALQWLDGVEDDQERARVELTLNGILTPALMASQGYGAPALEVTTRRSLALIDTLGDDPHVFPTLWALTAYHHVRSHRRQACTLAQRYVEMAERAGDTSQLVAALPVLAQCVWLEGHFEAAKALLERAIGLYDPAAHRDHAVRYGMDALAYSRMTLSQVLWVMGYADQAQEQASMAVTHAKALPHANTIAMALLYVMRLHTHQGEREQVIEAGNEVQAHCERYGLVFTQPLARLMSAWALGDVHTARQILAANEAMELRIGMTSYRSLVADSEAACGRYDEALALLQACFDDVERTGERYSLAHLYRLQGCILLAQDSTAAGAAEGCFRQAMAVAHEQHAPMLELLATTALCQLWRQGGNIRPAREMLAKIYDQFVEGFATPPLVAARALLEALGRDAG
jgi:TOMM system kinase/cyclase fusion protein